jgi:hypothetical protein
MLQAEVWIPFRNQDANAEVIASLHKEASGLGSKKNKPAADKDPVLPALHQELRLEEIRAHPKK